MAIALGYIGDDLMRYFFILIQIAAHVLWFGYNIKEAVDARRLHHQLIPQLTYHEPDFPEVIIKSIHK
jgi:gamma-glutamyltranspeptidase